ncbi:hypothetical protein [Beduini massiliensis]|uniref:hypothetical protein n=1 Tax=Beduini massiliensis TaxID=1585974 RepID=UPI00059AA367|nr:hypothetical protein [Beduini massiliensis]
MKNFKKVMAVAASAAMVMTLTACGGGSSSKYTKVGFGMVTSVSEKGEYNQVNTTMATVGLDSKGKIQYVDLDVAQQNTNNADETRTKMEKKEDYGMKKFSGIEKELYEQVEFLEGKLIGMTAEDVKNIEVYDKDDEHKSVPKEGSDIASGCTISIADFQAAIQKAFDNMAEVKADKIGAGEVISVDATKGQVNTTVAQVALDSKGAIVWSNLDVAQTSNASDVRSKMEKKEDYGMKKFSGIEKELYEQVNFLVEKLKGMTAADVKAIEVYDKDDEHKSVPKEGTDIASGCTISIADFQAALAEAFETAK